DIGTRAPSGAPSFVCANSVTVRDAVGGSTYPGQMARSSSVYVCSACGNESLRWEGRCNGCGEWNTLVEEVRAAASSGSGRAGGRGGRRSGAGGSAGGAGVAVKPVSLGSVKAEDHTHLSTGIGERDNVLGGAVAPATLVLLGGAPGVGKSRQP